MEWNFMFFTNSFLLGVGLAMDAFSVALANGIGDCLMKKKKMCTIAGTYSFFQFLMPMIGWLCVHTVLTYFNAFEKFVPYIASILLFAIGVKMIIECVKAKPKTEEERVKDIGFGTLVIQGIATSIDALSVGFTIQSYGFVMAFISSIIIGTITFEICYAGLIIGKEFGDKFSKAEIIGGIILICISIFNTLNTF